MGSIEVYDLKQEKWVPFVPDPDEWYQHFKDLRDGYVQPDHMGRYIVGSGKKFRRLKEMEGRIKEIEAREKQIEAREKELALREQKGPTLKQVTPVAQALEIAKSEIERERKKEGDIKRKKAKTTQVLAKRLKRYAYNPDDQV